MSVYPKLVNIVKRFQIVCANRWQQAAASWRHLDVLDWCGVRATNGVSSSLNHGRRHESPWKAAVCSILQWQSSPAVFQHLLSAAMVTHGYRWPAVQWLVFALTDGMCRLWQSLKHSWTVTWHLIVIMTASVSFKRTVVTSYTKCYFLTLTWLMSVTGHFPRWPPSSKILATPLAFMLRNNCFV